MMDHLIAVAADIRGGLMEVLENEIASCRVQGALLGVDKYWYWCAVVLGLSRESGDFPFDSRVLLKRYEFGLAPIRRIAEIVQVLSVHTRFLLDWNFRPADWAEHCKAMGYHTEWGDGVPSPVVIRVLLRSESEARELARLADRPRRTADSQTYSPQRLPHHYREYPIVYETRPSAVATSLVRQVSALSRRVTGYPRLRWSWPSISAGRTDPKTSGTVGGCLIDPTSGKRFAVSCAHVFGRTGTTVFSPGPYEDSSHRRVGFVRYHSVSALKASGDACSLHVQPDAGRLDVAVAELDPEAPPPEMRLDRVRPLPRMHQFQPVSYVGSESGLVAAQLNNLTIWQEVFMKDFGDGPAGLRCFGDVFELSGRTGDIAPVAQEGDSGAWVIDEADGLRSWNGILFASQGMRAYACFAEFAMNGVRSVPPLGGIALMS